MNLLKPDPEFRNGYKDKARMSAIHDLPCSLCYLKGWTQKTRTAAHHKIGLGIGKKASDKLSMALCDSHHQHGQDAIHHIGVPAFEKKFDVSQDDLILLTDRMLEKLN